MKMYPYRLIDGFRAGLVLFPAVLLVGVCDVCRTGGGWGASAERGLATAGLGFGLVSASLAIAARRRPALSEAGDALTVILALGGLLLAVAAASSYAKPCPLCLGFWACALGLFAELLLSDRAMGRWAARAAVVGAASAGLVAFTPSSKAIVASWLPVPPDLIGGPSVGSTLPATLKAPRNGIVALVTDCPRCWASVLKTKLNLYGTQGRSLVLVAIPSAKSLVAEMPGVPTVYVDAAIFDAMRIAPQGSPFLVQTMDGRVVLSAPASAFAPLEKEP